MELDERQPYMMKKTVRPRISNLNRNTEAGSGDHCANMHAQLHVPLRNSFKMEACCRMLAISMCVDQIVSAMPNIP